MAPQLPYEFERQRNWVPLTPLPFITLQEVCSPKKLTIPRPPTNPLLERAYLIEVVGKNLKCPLGVKPLELPQLVPRLSTQCPPHVHASCFIQFTQVAGTLIQNIPLLTPALGQHPPDRPQRNKMDILRLLKEWPQPKSNLLH